MAKNNEEGLELTPMPHIDLLELPHFAQIPLGEVVSLIDAMAPRQLEPGQTIVSAGDVPTALIVTTAGKLALSKDARAATIEAPCALPVQAFFAQAPSATKAVAVNLVSCFALPHSTFVGLLQARHPALSPFLRNLLAMPATLHAGLVLG